MCPQQQRAGHLPLHVDDFVLQPHNLAMTGTTLNTQDSLIKGVLHVRPKSIHGTCELEDWMWNDVKWWVSHNTCWPHTWKQVITLYYIPLSLWWAATSHWYKVSRIKWTHYGPYGLCELGILKQITFPHSPFTPAPTWCSDAEVDSFGKSEINRCTQPSTQFRTYTSCWHRAHTLHESRLHKFRYL